MAPKMSRLSSALFTYISHYAFKNDSHFFILPINLVWVFILKLSLILEKAQLFF
jgi:hypothetical protein